MEKETKNNFWNYWGFELMLIGLAISCLLICWLTYSIQKLFKTFSPFPPPIFFAGVSIILTFYLTFHLLSKIDKKTKIIVLSIFILFCISICGILIFLGTGMFYSSFHSTPKFYSNNTETHKICYLANHTEQKELLEKKKMEINEVLENISTIYYRGNLFDATKLEHKCQGLGRFADSETGSFLMCIEGVLRSRVFRQEGVVNSIQISKNLTTNLIGTNTTFNIQKTGFTIQVTPETMLYLLNIDLEKESILLEKNRKDEENWRNLVRLFQALKVDINNLEKTLEGEKC